MKKKIKKIGKIILYILISIIILLFLNYISVFLVHPEDGGDWAIGQGIKAENKIQNNEVEIKNFRNFNWISKSKAERNYKNIKFDLNEIEDVDLVVSRWNDFKPMAHTFLIFNLKNNQKIGLSIESRRHSGDSFNTFDGFFYHYNLIYVWASQRDLFQIRKIKKEQLSIYKLKLSKEDVKKMFLNYLKRTNEIKEKPEYYHVFWKNCANLLLDEMNDEYQDKIPFWVKSFAPGYLAKKIVH